MAASMSTTLTSILKEEIQSGTLHLLNQKSPVYQFIDNSTDRVANGDGIGRDWYWKHPVSVGVAGTVRNRAVGNASQWNSAGTAPSNLASTLAAYRQFPGFDQSAFVGFTNFQVQLFEQFGNFFLPHELLRGNRLTAMVVDVIAMNIKAVVENLAQVEHAYLWTSDTTDTPLGIVGSSVTAGTTSDKYATFNLSAGKPFMFQEGMILYHYSSADSRGNTAKILLVRNVDPVAGLVTVGTADDSTLGTAIVATDYFTVAESRGVGSAGFYSWIANTGTVQNVTVTNWTKLKSIVGTLTALTGTSTLSETALAQVFGHYANCYGPKLSNAFTTTEVLNQYYDNMLYGGTFNQARHVRSGPIEQRAGFAGLTFVYAGREAKMWADPLCPAGTMHSIKTDEGNIKRLTPPRVNEFASDARFGAELEFVGDYDGSGNAFLPFQANDGGASNAAVTVTDLVQAPFSRVMNRVVIEPQGLRITGIDELGCTAT